MSSEKTVEFPFISLTPKKETGVSSFLQKYGQEYDGRGVIIAILDSGLDPAVEGLKITSTGLPKVIERYDCSGCGDVDTKTILKTDESGCVTGFDGTVFKIPENWSNPSGVFHYGVKPLYDLFLDKILEQAQAKRKEEFWDKPQRLASIDAIQSSPIGIGGINGNNSTVIQDKLEKEESEAKLEALDLLEKKYKDWGPVIHCFLFQDNSEVWNIALALSSDLSKLKLLHEFSLDQSWTDLTNESRLTVSVNVWENGDKLEIVGMSSGHGTHVASIAAGYFPEKPELNGVAPGAQIISLSVGDNRLGSMETMQAISRACAFLQKNCKRVHLLNMSYGENAHYANGRVGELIRETIDEYGIIWCGSGGNRGPALSTVGSPPWIGPDNIIGVAAYISPDMMSAEYSLREKNQAGIYTWSSRGPTIDGDLGLTISAPGGAITSVPHYTKQNAQLMNGTSMASPHCAGVIAILISMAIQKGIPYSPFSVKRALANGATPIEGSDPFSTGAGLINIEKTWEKLVQASTAPERDVRFNVTVASNQRGIYIRGNRTVNKEHVVSVEPIFYNDKNIEIQAKIDFRLNLVLVSSATWVQCPEFLDLYNMSRSFSVKVDSEGLPSGAHYAKIEAFDVKDVTRGPVFQVHVSVIVPLKMTEGLTTLDLPYVHYEPNLIKRHILLPPKGSNSLSLTIRNDGKIVSRMVIHSITLCQDQWCKAEEYYKVLQLGPGEDTTVNFKVREERIVELCIGRWWSDAKETVPIHSRVQFRSLILDVQEITCSVCDVYSRLHVTSAFQTEEIQPSVSLKNQVALLRATSMKLSSLSEERDGFPSGRLIFQLISQYNVVVSRPCTITINCTLLSEILYEGEYEGQLWMLFDSSKRMVGVGDAYPDHWPVKLEKGEYVLRLHIRHEKREALEKLINGHPNFQGDALSPNLPVLISAKLQTPITLNIHQSPIDLQCSKKGTGWSSLLRKGVTKTIYLSTNISEKSLKNLPIPHSTHYLSGSLQLQKEEKRGYPLRVFLPDPAPKTKQSSLTSPGTGSGEKSKDDILEQIRDVKVSWMGKVDKEESLKLFQELVGTCSNHFPIYTARISVLESQLKETIEAEAVTEIQTEIRKLISTILENVDKASLLSYFANKCPDAKLKTQMERTRGAFIEAHVKRGLLFPEDSSDSWTEATSFCEPSDSKVVELTIVDAIQRNHWGRALKYLLKAEDSLNEKEKRLTDVIEKLGWKGVKWWLDETARFKASMKDYRLF